MSHKMNYDTLAIELGQVALQRDTYRELCGELLAQLQNTYELAEECDSAVESAIAKAEAILGENNAT